MDPYPAAPKVLCTLLALFSPTLFSVSLSEDAFAGDRLARTSSSVKAKTVVLTDSERIADLVDAPLPFEPVVGVLNRVPKGESLQVFGVRSGEVWVSRVENAFVRMAKVGRHIEITDPRIQGYEAAVCNGRVVMAYEPAGPSTANGALAPEAILQSETAFYNVKKLADRSFSIEKIGHAE